MSLSVNRERAASASALEETMLDKEFEGRRGGESSRRAETVDVYSTVDGKATRLNGQACLWVSPGLSIRIL